MFRQNKVVVYDPTAKDEQSAVRGIGRYLQILKENFENELEFVSDLGSVTPDLNTFINPFFNFLQPPLFLKRIAKKQIAVIHDLIPLKYPSHFPHGIKGSIYILLNKLALRNYDLIITDSEASKVDIIKILGIQENKIKVIYPCLPKTFLSFPPLFRDRLQRESRNHGSLPAGRQARFHGDDNSFCLYVGDATWNKNLVNLAKAIKIADINCVFVGKVFSNVGVDPRVDPKQNKWMAELKEFIELTKDDKRFKFMGFVPDSELIKLYEQTSFNILPSRDEGFGFSYLEASQFSCPSLLSDIPVLREISAGNALYIDPENPENIAKKIIEINSDKISRKKIGEQAKKRSEFFSQKKFREEIRSVLKLTR